MSSFKEKYPKKIKTIEEPVVNRATMQARSNNEFVEDNKSGSKVVERKSVRELGASSVVNPPATPPQATKKTEEFQSPSKRLEDMKSVVVDV